MKISRILLLVCLVFAACSTEDDGGDTGGGNATDAFDRGEMLANWADNIILPSYEDFSTKTQRLEELAQAFVDNPGNSELTALRAQFELSYKSFQSVSMFDIGKAEELNYRSFLNTYPLNASDVESKVEAGSYNFELPSSYDEQGFPALDYLLYGLGSTKESILTKYTTDANAENYKAYLLDVTKRINALTTEVTNSWQGDYRDTFVNNTSSSSTGSVDRLTNKYVMYFEKFLRSGKIGFPSGAITGAPSPINVEAYYAEDFSKELYLEALKSSKDFFTGKYFGSSETGKSYQAYLEALDREELSSDILSQFNTISSMSGDLDTSLRNQVETNNTLMLEVHDELQKEVVLLKLDMLQALSISVDYVDSDGD
ncbi:imelysin family protein [Gramella sp. MAR_2010_147]|uniref:imelysin family protein n=1 Tax=Gramella sp. MAR_2010_147 TaxID=1250205 RepID=UPI00087CD045|nr:imelysin family protein [Gramella sp. MAR_2010_147]SDS68107.1 Imelysin [Gramella sp. MAR_2010_147]